MPKGLLAPGTRHGAVPPTRAVAGLRGLQGGPGFRQVAGLEFSQGDTPLPLCFFAVKMGGAIFGLGWGQVRF